MYLSVVLPHAVSDAHGYVRAHPDSDAARDLSATDSLAKTLGEHPPLPSPSKIVKPS